MIVPPCSTHAAASAMSVSSASSAAYRIRTRLCRGGKDPELDFVKCNQRVPHSSTTLSRRPHAGLYRSVVCASAGFVWKNPSSPRQRSEPPTAQEHATPCAARACARGAVAHGGPLPLLILVSAPRHQTGGWAAACSLLAAALLRGLPFLPRRSLIRRASPASSVITCFSAAATSGGSMLISNVPERSVPMNTSV